MAAEQQGESLYHAQTNVRQRTRAELIIDDLMIGTACRRGVHGDLLVRYSVVDGIIQDVVPMFWPKAPPKKKAGG